VYTIDINALRQITQDPTIPKYYKNLPCSTMIGVTHLSHPDFLVEIDLIAVANE
jgi:enamine deaminase RidA (YjgF/YER057c/UK114 family)